MNDNTAVPTEDWHEKQRKATEELRGTCLQKLRELGVKKVKASYDGYGDQGNVSEVKFKPKKTAIDADLQTEVHDLIWRLIYQTNPGFENNDGGRGEIKWTIKEDYIIIWHYDCVVTEILSEHEGV